MLFDRAFGEPEIGLGSRSAADIRVPNLLDSESRDRYLFGLRASASRLCEGS